MRPIVIQGRVSDRMLESFVTALLAAVVGCGDVPGTSKDRERDAPGCSADEDCGPAEVCDNGACEPSPCVPGSSACSAGGLGLSKCEDDGSQEVLIPCRSGERCMVVDGEARCRELPCVPNSWSCDEEGRYAERCADDGSGIDERLDCSEAGETCRDGVCQELECPAGSLACDGDIVTICEPTGKAFVPSDTDCADQGEACLEGACVKRICTEPFTCVDGGSVACLDNGTRTERSECESTGNAFCNEATGQCEPHECVPGAAMCDRGRATRCDDIGSGPLAGGVECNSLTQVCWDGGCATALCSGDWACLENELLRCELGGTQLAHEMHCGPGTQCDADVGSCVPAACQPNAPVCRGTVATTCRADGLGFEDGGQDCALAEQACTEGLCSPRVCVPQSVFCTGQDLRRCDATGSQFEVLATCSETETCDEELQTCVAHACVPNQPLCDDDNATVCLLDGSGPAPGGIDCYGQGQVCVAGSCKTTICEPSLSFCQAGNVYQCNASGTAAAPVQTCDAEQVCEVFEDGAACVPGN